MLDTYRNIYRNARRAAGFTQEKAAEALGLSVESIRAYESGRTIPSDVIVADMIICYDAQRLGQQHLQEHNILLPSIVPELEERPVLEAVVRLYNAIKKLERSGSVDRLLEIAEDGKIDEEERPVFDEIMEILRDLARGSLELDLFFGQAEE